MPKLEDHPLAEIFPLMGDADFGALVADVRENGMRDAVWLFEGKILDGRNRYRACDAAGIEDVPVRHYTGPDPLGFVISKNLRRRHLTESQRSMVAANIANAKAGRPSAETSGIPLVSQAKAAEMLNVSVDSVKAAVKVKTEGAPELVEAVKAGDVSVSAAAEVAKLPKAEQKKAVKEKKVKETAAGERKKKATTRATKSNPGSVSKADDPAPQVSDDAADVPDTADPPGEPVGKAGGKPGVLKDQLGNVVPRCVADTFGDPMLAAAIARIDAAHKELVSVEHHVATTLSRKGEFWPYAQFGECCKSLKDAITSAANASNQLAIGTPFCVCPKCRGEGCKDCRNSGAWSRHRHEQRAQYGDA